MELSEYKVGDRVDVYLFREKRPATVTSVSDEGVEVVIDNPIKLSTVNWRDDFITYIDPAIYLERFLIKYAGLIDKIKE